MAQVHGTCDPRFEKVRSLLQQYLDSGEEVGATFTVNIDGEDVINLWGGHADAARTRAWTEDTIVPLASSTKTVSALAVLLLVERGALSVTDKVSTHWPEFGANGKQDIEIRHLLSHTSGVAGWDEKLRMEDICDPVSSSAKLAAQAPWWEPGTASAYHAWNYGHLLSEVVRRVTGGQGLKAFVAEQVAAPLRADFQLGLRDEDVARLAEFILPAPAANAPPPADFKPGPLFARAILNPAMAPGVTQSAAWRQGEIGASNGYGNAQALNRILRHVSLADAAGGREERTRLLSRPTVDLIFEEQSRGQDLAVGTNIRFGVGYALRGDGESWVDDWLPEGRIAYWGGSGGSLGIMDVGRRMTITYAMNVRSSSLIGNTASKAYIAAVYEALGVM
ncbi:beta-lactamase [Xylariomycetidae sp. FL0641]|nr:beta-lactamase [Xylariomycetidae sp. FL0641]